MGEFRAERAMNGSGVAIGASVGNAGEGISGSIAPSGFRWAIAGASVSDALKGEIGSARGAFESCSNGVSVPNDVSVTEGVSVTECAIAETDGALSCVTTTDNEGAMGGVANGVSMIDGSG